MSDPVKIKVLQSFDDTTHGPFTKGDFKKVSREKADHYIEHKLAEEIVVQNKMNPAKVLETKPAAAPKVATKASGVKDGGKSGNAGRSKSSPAGNKRK